MKLYELFNKPENWTQGVLARDKDGKMVECHSDTAYSFCLNGGILKCYGYDTQRVMVSDIFAFVSDSINESISKWNDNPSRTHAEVLSLVRKLNI